MTETYYLVQSEGESPISKYGPYKDAATAAFWAKKAENEFGTKIRPRRLSQAGDWRTEMQREIAVGLWTQPPKAWDLAPIADHYIHLPKDNEFTLAYFPKEIDAVMRKAREIKPGAYLEKFYPQLSAEEKKRYAGIINMGGDVQFAWTEDEIDEAYRTGPSSCMSYNAGDYNQGIRPVRMYAAGDLAVAYLKNRFGKVAERAICWPEKKIFGRVYSGGTNPRLKKVLLDLGYTESKIASDFDGARLLRKLADRNRYFRVPYIDGNNQHGSQTCTRVRDIGTYLIIDHENGPMHANSTGGLIGACRVDQYELTEHNLQWCSQAVRDAVEKWKDKPAEAELPQASLIGDVTRSLVEPVPQIDLTSFAAVQWTAIQDPSASNVAQAA